MYWRQASLLKTVKRSQAPYDANVLKWFFRDNFVSFRHRSKRIAILESANFSTCVFMQIFNVRDSHVTTFCTIQGPYLPNAWLQTLQAHLQSLGFLEGYSKRRENAVLDLAPPTLPNSGIFQDITRPHLHFYGLPPKSRRSVVSIYSIYGALQVLHIT